MTEDQLLQPEERASRPSGPIVASAWPMWVLGFVIGVDSMDQSIVRGVQTLIQDDFGLSDFAVGWLASAFVFVHAITVVPAGYLADRLHRRRVIASTVVLWSLITALTGAASSFVMLLLIRGALGFGLGITEPSANSLLTDYYPTQQRGRAFSIQQLMTFVGFGLGIALGGIVGDALGWRWAFVIVGLPGVLTALMVQRLREPKRGHGDRLSMGIASSLDDEHDEHPRLFEHGLGTFLSDMVRGLWADVKTIMQIPTLKYVLVGVGVLLFAVAGIGYWLPAYYERFLDMTTKEAGAAVGAMVVIGGVAGTLVGGVLADKYQNRIKGGRIAIPAYSVMLGSVIFTLGLLPVPRVVALLAHVMALFVFTLAVPAMRAGVGDAVPAHLRGAGFAAFGLISGVFGSAAAPPLIGVISDATNLRTSLIVCMPLVFIGAVVLNRARHHLDEDVAKVMMAVQRAYQEQEALEAKRAAEEQPGS